MDAGGNHPSITRPDGHPRIPVNGLPRLWELGAVDSNPAVPTMNMQLRGLAIDRAQRLIGLAVTACDERTLWGPGTWLTNEPRLSDRPGARPVSSLRRGDV